jgi:hypothetical protein
MLAAHLTAVVFPFFLGGAAGGAGGVVFTRNQLSKMDLSATSCNSEGNLFTTFRISSRSVLSLSSIDEVVLLCRCGTQKHTTCERKDRGNDFSLAKRHTRAKSGNTVVTRRFFGDAVARRTCVKIGCSPGIRTPIC